MQTTIRKIRQSNGFLYCNKKDISDPSCLMERLRFKNGTGKATVEQEQ
jgi:hypothetical protein